MDSTTLYQETARTYADGVRVLFAPSGRPTGERGGRGPVSPTDLADQAEKLVPLSEDLAKAATAQLAAEDANVRARASTQLLAKALTDLQISARLFQAAEDEELRIKWEGGEGTERSAPGLGAIEESLTLLLGDAEVAPERVERGTDAPTDIGSARVALFNSIDDALTLISRRASRTGQSALGGLLGLGAGELAQAAGMVGIGIAQALGQAQKVTRLFTAFRTFLKQVYDSLLALLGQQLAQAAAKQVLQWVDDLQKGELFAQVLEKLYETKVTGKALKLLVSNSQAALPELVTTIEKVDGLNTSYLQQIDLAERLLRGVKLVGGVPAAVLPQGRLLLSAAYIVLGAYVVLAGADYVDAQRLKSLNRVPGVRQVVEGNLASR